MNQHRLRKYLVTIAIGAALTVAVVFVFVPLITQFRERLNGNYPIKFFGRVVDGKGVGLANVSVEIQIGYSEHLPRPGMFGREELLRRLTVVSDGSGDFQLTGASGFNIAIKSFKLNGRNLNWAFAPTDTLHSPRTSFVYDERTSAAAIPDVPGRRLSYFLSP